MREPDFFEKNRPQWLPYLVKDVVREAARLGVPFAFPRPDPIAMNMGTGKVDAEQPLIDRLMRLGVAAEATEKAGLRFARAAARRIWGGTENWPDFLDDTAAESGLNLATLEAFAAAAPRKVADIIAQNETEQMAHHWGVPLMVLDGEPFFGQDRLDSLVWKLELS